MNRIIKRRAFAKFKLWLTALTLFTAYCAVSYGLGMVVALSR